MLPSPFPHNQYVRFVRNKARRYGLRTDHRHFLVWRKLKQTNLDLAYPLLSILYSSRQGRPARNPVSMLRSCLAMMECGVTSFDVWGKMMHDEPFYAFISGFDPKDTPGVGTFYDFQDRLLQRQHRSRTTRCRPRRRRDKRDKANHHKNKYDLRPHSGIVNRLVDRILARSSTSPPLAAVLEGYGDFSALYPYERILQPIFFACVIARSFELGLIDLADLYVAGDGSKLPTWANSHGRKLCSCDNRSKKPEDRCSCLRAYRDPLALWGWDSYRQCWVYGHSFYELVTYSFKHRCQLPLVVSITDCNRHDSVHALATLYHAREIFGFPIRVASLDSAHDTVAYFRLATTRWRMALVIPLNQRNKDNLRYAGPLRLEDDIPICAAGLPMKRAGFCSDRLRIKWRCPLAASRKTPPLSSCPLFANGCSASPYGRVVYTYPEQNYRLHTLIPRDSDLWQSHKDARSCSERSIKRKKYDFCLLQTRTAGRDRWFFRLMLAAMCQHIDAWLAHVPHRLN